MHTAIETEELNFILKATKGRELFIGILQSPGGSPLNSQKISDCLCAVEEALPRENEYELTLPIACLYAAGIAVNMRNLGARVEGIQPHPALRGFPGAVGRGRFAQITDRNLAIFREGVSAISGLAGERVAGQPHPSSGVFGKVLTGIYSNELARIYKKKPEYFFLKSLAYADLVIARNRHTFNSLVYTLTKTGELSAEEARSIFKTFVYVPLSLKDSVGAIK